MLEYVYQATGLLLIAFSVQTYFDKEHKKRLGTTLFWLLYGLSFMLGKVIPDWLTGLMVLGLTLIAASGFMGHGNYKYPETHIRKRHADTFKNKLFIPAILVPIVTILWAKLTGTSALIGLGISAILALVLALIITKGSPKQSLNDGRRLIDSIGWAAILSQFLAALGYLFGEAGVGDTVSQIVKAIVIDGNLLMYVLCYTCGMALFTIIMGNAFAAFAVITTGIAVPLLIVEQGGNPVIIGVIGMLSGYCGTLMTPMAANFNIVPAALLELKNKNQVIQMQFLPGLLMLAINTSLIYFLAF